MMRRIRSNLFSPVVRIWKDALKDLMEERARNTQLRKQAGSIYFQLSKNKKKTLESERDGKNKMTLDESGRKNSPMMKKTAVTATCENSNIRHETAEISYGTKHQSLDERYVELSDLFLDNRSLDYTKNCSHWKPIFRFPHIKAVVMFNRFKTHQTLLGSIGCLYLIGRSIIFPSTISLSTFALLTGGIFTIAAMTFLGLLSQRLIAIIYLDPSGEFVRVSRFTFWASRSDSIYPVSRITTAVPLDSQSIYNHIIVTEKNVDETITVTQHEEDEEDEEKEKVTSDQDFFKDYYLTLKFGGIIEPNDFDKLFGLVLKNNDEIE